MDAGSVEAQNRADSRLAFATSLDEVLADLHASPVIFFPVRHHSPACAIHLARLIRSRRPTAVLVEGPEDATALIPTMLAAEARAPFAVYTSYIDRARRIRAPDAGESASELPGSVRDETPRFGAYFPLCDHSPELVALREGHAIGAELRFIDLNFPEQLVAGRATQPGSRERRVTSLVEEAHLTQSRYVGELTRRSRCRDANDLWDHLFETRVASPDTARFIDALAAFCWSVRVDQPAELRERDGTVAREHAMAAEISAALARHGAAGRSGGVLVVTGGFHTVALPRLVASARPGRTPLRAGPDEALTVLTRYSFEQLDALNGYASGMPSPQFYARVWTAARDGAAEPLAEAARGLLVDLGRHTRERALAVAVSVSDEIAAFEQTLGLATLRDHPGPTREDVLDGARSAFVKGAMDAEGAVLMELLREQLSGSEIGDVPASERVAPLVDDFRRRATACRLRIEQATRQRTTLEIYRKAAHRTTSHLLHRLAFLRVPFGSLAAGPDFANGIGLTRIEEVWEYAWSPLTEAALIERSHYGATVEEAALASLRERLGDLERSGGGRNALAGVRALVQACQMGLHGAANEICAQVAPMIAEDPSFGSLVQALAELRLLWQAREPLEAHRLTQVPMLAMAAYQRACGLVDDAARTSGDEAFRTVDALMSLREVVGAEESEAELTFDPALLWTPLHSLAASPPGAAAPIVGAAVGLLGGAGQLDDAAIAQRVAGRLGGTRGAIADRTAFLRGLLRTCREAAWRVPELLTALDVQLASWEEAEFLAALPELRLAFAELTPREADRVGELVARRHGATHLGELTIPRITQSQLLENLALDQELTRALAHDGLADWPTAQSDEPSAEPAP